jgi:hypothetical protein
VSSHTGGTAPRIHSGLPHCPNSPESPGLGSSRAFLPIVFSTNTWSSWSGRVEPWTRTRALVTINDDSRK